MKRFAFTMLELIFVIIVIAMLAVLAMPNFNRNLLQEAADQVAGHIRYTQHLAMNDDKFDPNDGNWHIENWQMQFKPLMGDVYYEIYSDVNHGGNSDNNESAIDPLTHEALDGNSEITNLTQKFGITAVAFSNNCHAGASIGELAFDKMGRPYYYITSTQPAANHIYQYLLTADCVISLQGAEGNATITVRPETGYVSVVLPN